MLKRKRPEQMHCLSPVTVEALHTNSGCSDCTVLESIQALELCCHSRISNKKSLFQNK